MEFRISDTFTSSLNKLQAKEKKAAKLSVIDLQLNPATKALRFHRVKASKDKNFWSARVNDDIRLVVHKTDASFLVCYAGHHDDAYNWAERRKIETHPRTGAAQLVVLREVAREVAPAYQPPAEPQVAAQPAAPPLFASMTVEDMLGFGVPEEWVEDALATTEDSLFTLVDLLPAEAGEALLQLATGGTPTTAEPVAAGADPFAHPDAQRRFRVMTNVEELERALEAPWERWSVFLHPAQRDLVHRKYKGPARVGGTAGTGKTVVALHRAVHLAKENADANVLLATFSPALAASLADKLQHLAGNEQPLASRIHVRDIAAMGCEIFEKLSGNSPRIVSDDRIRELLTEAAGKVQGHQFTPRFLFAEWSEVVDAWQLDSWEEYRNTPRTGRRSRVGEKQRETLWAIFSNLRKALHEQQLLTLADVFDHAAAELRSGQQPPYTFAVVDESQDLSVPALRLLAALTSETRPDALFFAGDLGQRIFQPPFSWKSLGVDIRGRSHTLEINYRTSHQIRSQADRLLPGAVSDVDGNKENRDGTISVFNGPPPEISLHTDAESEAAAVGAWLAARFAEGVQPQEAGVIVRTGDQFNRAQSAIEAAGTHANEFTGQQTDEDNGVTITTMHLAKGLEFRVVAVMACDDDIIPLEQRIEDASDDASLAGILDTERHLLYVAATRARDHLHISGVKPGSEFLEDLQRRE